MHPTPPDIKTILDNIHQAYGIQLARFTFLLRGWGGDCFLGESSTGETYFIKIHDKEVNSVFAASSRAFYLPLMDQLYSKGILPQIPHPIPTLEGVFSLEIDSQVVVITGFIEGEDLGFGRLPYKIISQLGELVGKLHASLPEFNFKAPFIDEFEISFGPFLLEYLSRLDANQLDDTPGQVLLQKALESQVEEIRSYFNQLKRQGEYARNADHQKVICHTDLHGGNLRLDPGGNLYILDWENALIAPREHDMIFFMGEAEYREVFWSAYTRHFPEVKLDLDLLRFYFLRRGLEDITDYIFRILAGDGGLERDQSDLTELLECLDGLSRIESTLIGIQAFLLGSDRLTKT